MTIGESRSALVFVHASADLYGSDITLLDLVFGIDKHRFHPIVVLPYYGPLVPRLRGAGAEVVVRTDLPILRRQHTNVKGMLRLAASSFRSVGWLTRFIRRRRVSLVHSNTLATLIPGLAAMLARRPQVWHVHEIVAQPRAVAYLLATCSSAASTLVVANSRATADHYRQTRLASSTPIEIILNGVEESRLRADPNTSLRFLVGAGPEDTVFTLVGRVNRLKGHSVFIEAATLLVTEVEGARFLIVGDSFAGQEHLSEMVDQRIEASEVLRGRMIRVPHVAQVGAVYAASDVAVVPSTEPESFGLVAVEAMAAGLPVIASRIGALPEVVEDGRTGILVPPNSAVRLSAAMKRLVESPSERAEMGWAGRERFESHFRVERYVAEFTKLYERLADDFLSGKRASFE